MSPYIEIGSLIRDYQGDIALVIDHWIHDESGEYHTVIKWLTGRYAGETDALYTDYLEVIA